MMITATNAILAATVGASQVASLSTDTIDFATIFSEDDECTLGSACALELAQLRASKVLAAPGPGNAEISAFEAAELLQRPQAANAEDVAAPSSFASGATMLDYGFAAPGPGNAEISAFESAEFLQQPQAANAEDVAVPSSFASGATVLDYGHPEWLQSCRTIFLDLGSGNGTNVRKLFEPNQFQESTMMPIIDETIGSPGWRRAPFEKTGLCALGLEPDPLLQEELLRVEADFEVKGWHVHFYPMAAWVLDGYMPFDTSSQPDEVDAGDHKHLSMSSPVAREAGEGTVLTVDIASFIASLPPRSVKLMTVDIEGAEYEALAGLMQQRLMCQYFVANALVRTREWGNIEHWGTPESFSPGVHPRSFLGVTERMRQLKELSWCAPGDPTQVLELDELEAESKPDEQSFISLGQPVLNVPVATGLVAGLPVANALLASAFVASAPMASVPSSTEAVAIASVANAPVADAFVTDVPVVAGIP